jgi:uncharacterized lipoprotein NlpE involved in copper resistance
MLTRILTATVAMFAALFMLAGCQETDEQVRSLLTSFCPSAEATFVSYDEIAAAGVLSQSVIDKGNAAKKAANSVCTNRETATVASVTTAGILAFAALRDATREAEAKGVDVGYPVKNALSRIQKGLDRHGR